MLIRGELLEQWSAKYFKVASRLAEAESLKAELVEQKRGEPDLSFLGEKGRGPRNSNPQNVF